MLTFNSILGTLAPHQCIACGFEGAVLCDPCLAVAGDPIPPRCAGCHKLDENWKTCNSCRSWLHAENVRVVAPYSNIYEALIHVYKFDLKRDACEPISSLIAELLADKKFAEYILVPLPTAPSRIRKRGFDNAKLLSRSVAKKTGMTPQPLLRRRTNVRQVGASRTQRILQMEREFYTNKPESIKGKSFLLLDDVMTSGASIAAATKTLKKAGASHVAAIVFAQKM